MSDNSFIQCKVTGQDRIIKLLKELPSNIQKKVLRKAARNASNIIKEEAKRQLSDNTKTGKLAKSLTVESKKGRPGDIVFHIGPSRKAPYGHLVEYGTAEHIVSAGMKRGKKTGKKVLYDFKTRTFFGKTVSVKAKKNPFLRPAAEIKFREAVGAFETAIAEYLKTVTVTLAGGI